MKYFLQSFPFVPRVNEFCFGRRKKENCSLTETFLRASNMTWDEKEINFNGSENIPDPFLVRQASAPPTGPPLTRTYKSHRGRPVVITGRCQCLAKPKASYVLSLTKWPPNILLLLVIDSRHQRLVTTSRQAKGSLVLTQCMWSSY